MKRIISIILSCAIVVGFSSCSEEEDIFNESSALRTNHTVETYKDLLTSAENGWLMEYFANLEEPGYPMLVKFGKDGSVVVGAKNHYSNNNVYSTETSLYDVISDNGPVLTFNSYNTLLHIFSTPEDIPDTGTPDNPDDEQGLGHEGDYEFVIYEGDENHVRMKGKKYGIEISLYRLDANQAWDTYYDQIDATKAQLFNSKIQTLWLTVGDERYSITGMSEGLFKFVPEGGDAISQTDTDPFVVRFDGTVHLCVDFKGENENFAVRNFKLADDGTLKCIDENQNAYITFGMPVELIKKSILRLNKKNTDATVLDAYNTLSTTMRSEGYGALQYMQMVYNSTADKFEVTLRTSTVTSICYFNYTESNGNTLVLSLDLDAMKASEVANVQNAVVLYDIMPEFKAYVDLMATSFEVVTSSPLNVDAVNLQSSGYSIGLDLQ